MKHLPQQGFSLLELLTVITILSIVSSYAFPNLVQWQQQQKHQAIRDRLFYTLLATRSQAILQGRDIELCASIDGALCDGSWHKGWLSKASRSGEILFIETLAPPHSTLTWNGFREHIQFRANGQSPTGNGRFVLCDKQKVVWQIVINRQGRARLATSEENKNDSAHC